MAGCTGTVLELYWSCTWVKMYVVYCCGGEWNTLTVARECIVHSQARAGAFHWRGVGLENIRTGLRQSSRGSQTILRYFSEI